MRPFTSHQQRTSRRQGDRVSWGQRATVVGLLLAYLTITTGVIVPNSGAKDEAVTKSTTRFPCEDRVCGCAGGEHCWTHCHCQSLTQKMAWARREGVQPPIAALLLARRQGLDVSDWVQDAKPTAPNARTTRTARGNQSPSKFTAKVASIKAAAAKSAPTCACCAAKHQAKQLKQKSEEPPAQETNRDDGRVVILSHALACKGIAYQWMSVGEVVASKPDAFMFELNRTLESPCILISNSDSINLNPDPPPPQRV